MIVLSSTTVRISPGTLKRLKEVSSKMGRPLQEVLDCAVEEYRRKTVLEDANRAYAKLRENKGKWEEELLDRQEWDGTLADGVDFDDI